MYRLLLIFALLGAFTLPPSAVSPVHAGRGVGHWRSKRSKKPGSGVRTPRSKGWKKGRQKGRKARHRSRSRRQKAKNSDPLRRGNPEAGKAGFLRRQSKRLGRFARGKRRQVSRFAKRKRDQVSRFAKRKRDQVSRFAKRKRDQVSRFAKRKRTQAAGFAGRKKKQLRRFKRRHAVRTRRRSRRLRKTIGEVAKGTNYNDVAVGGILAATSGAAPGFSSAAQVAGGVAGIALLTTSASDFRRATTHLERVDAVHGGLWGIQTMSSLAGALGSSTPLRSFAAGLGVGGGIIQTAAGLQRIAKGIRNRDRHELVLGALDIGAGVTWGVSSVTANPVTSGLFVAFTAARLAYANRGAIRAAVGKTTRSFSGVARSTARASRALTGRSDGPIVTPLPVQD